MTLDKHIEFYKREIEEKQWEWDETFLSPVITLFNKGELFLARFEKYDTTRGTLIFSFSKDLDHLPRINEEFSCVVMRSEHKEFQNDARISYCDLLEGIGESDISDIRLVNYFQGPDPNRIGAIFSDADTGFINRLMPKMLLFIGPKEPPLEYLVNLKQLSERFHLKPNSLINPYLETSVKKQEDRLPAILYEKQNIPKILLETVEKKGLVVLQGPPGVGKTYLAAQLISTLLHENKSVLLTALTNKASIEVCKEETLLPFLQAGRLYKTALKSNEAKTHPGLRPTDKIHPIQGCAVLATYYTYSRVWQEATIPTFDYVIIEEASQSFLTTIVSAKLIGKKVLVIGDPYQIQPIVSQKRPEQVDPHIYELINGLFTFSSFLDYPYFRKVESRRLCPRAVRYTNFFYENQLESLKPSPDINGLKDKFSKLFDYLHKDGGPTLVVFKFSIGKTVPKARDFIVDLLMGSDHKKLKIAILAPFRETVGEMQGKIMKALNNFEIVIDTVDRVQGLDVDICFYIIPKGSHEKGLQFNRFNVATSRSKIATLILADESILNTNVGHPKAIQYIKELATEFKFSH